jgi:hypothetical protein
MRIFISSKPEVNTRVKRCATPRSFASIGKQCLQPADASLRVTGEIVGKRANNNPDLPMKAERVVRAPSI